MGRPAFWHAKLKFSEDHLSVIKTYLDQKPKTLADFIISRSVRPLKLFDPSFLLEGPLFSCNLQIEKISGPQEAARLVFYFAKHG